MQGYMVHFLAYSMAMVGFFGICIFIYKKLCIQGLTGKRTDFLTIENGLRLNARKQLLVIKAGNERFLVASDYDRTTMLAKLNSEEEEKEDNTVILRKNTVPQKNIYNNQILNFNSDKEEVVPPALKRINEKMKA